MGNKKLFVAIGGWFSGLQLIAVALVLYAVFSNYMVKTLNDVVWLLSFLVSYLVANTIERINFYKELMIDNEKLVKRIESLEAKVDSY